MADPAPFPPESTPPANRSNPAIWILPLLAAITLVTWDAIRQAQHFRQVSANYGVAVHAPRVDPTSATGLADGRRHVLYPARWVDGQHWIAQTQQMLADGETRVREVEHDNAPFGRPVHWASPFRWWLGLAALVERVLTGTPLAHAVETAAFFANPALLVVLLSILVPWVARRFGGPGAALLAIALAGSPPFRVLFAPDNPDHHGLIQLCAMAALFFVIGGGAGWSRDKSSAATFNLGWLPTSAQARRAFMFSAVAGGIGLWVSAVSLIPVFLGLALGALSSAWIGRKTSDAVFDPGLWRRWGAVGGLTAFCCYVVEYFPSHLGWRLEVNHPLYALAWLGAGEVLAWATARFSGSSSFNLGSPYRLAAGIAAMISPVVVIAVAGSRVFAVSDPFLWSLSHEYTPEFQSLVTAVRRTGWNATTVASCLPMLLVPLALGGVFAMKSPRVGAAVVALPLAAAALFWAMAFKELRWWTVGYGFLFGVVALAPALLAGATAKRWQRIAVWWIGAAAFAPGLFLTVQGTTRGPVLDRDHILSLAERDLAHSLRQRAGAGPLVVLSSPATTSRMIYFASAHGLGTAYWENLDGLKRAAAILAAKSPDEAHRLVKAANITHLVFVSWDDFVEPYIRLSRGLSRDEPLDGPAFGLELLRSSAVPPWLQLLPDHLPPLPAFANERIAIFEVTDRTRPEHVLVRDARHRLYRGQLQAARELIPELEEHASNLASQVSLGRVQFAAQNAAGVSAAIARVDRLLDQRHALEAEDRVDFIALFALIGRTAEARSFLTETLQSLDAPALRRLTPGSLNLLLVLSRRFGVDWPDPQLQSLASELLPPDGRI